MPNAYKDDGVLLAGRPVRMRAVANITVAVFLFSVVDVIVKQLTSEFPVNQIIFFRMVFGLVPAVLVMVREGSYHRLGSAGHLPLHLWRAVTAIAAMGLFFAALSRMPLAEAVALSFTETLFLVVMAIPLLGEPANAQRLLAAFIGFVGVVMIIRPTGDFSGVVGPLLATGSAVLFAVSMIAVCKLGQSLPTSVIVFYYTVIGTVFGGVSLAFSWKPPDLDSLMLFALLGLVGGAGQFLMTDAYREEAAGVIGPFNYTSIVWAAIFGYVIFGESISTWTVVGTALIIAGSACTARDRPR